MIRKLDRVLFSDVGSYGIFGRVVACDGREAHVDVGGLAPRVADVNDLVLLCCQKGCANGASLFFGENEEAICSEHAANYGLRTKPTRSDPNALASCVCGATLDGAPSHGVWTMGDLACEYRTCLNCHSTRAFMPSDVKIGRKVRIYEDRVTSEIAWEGDSLLDALAEVPARNAEIKRNGVTLARAVGHPNDAVRSRIWFVLPPERE